MKIKHWAGYGSVSIRKVKKSHDLHVVINGDHECGLIPRCNDTLYDWIRKYYDKKGKLPGSYYLLVKNGGYMLVIQTAYDSANVIIKKGE